MTSPHDLARRLDAIEALLHGPHPHTGPHGHHAVSGLTVRVAQLERAVRRIHNRLSNDEGIIMASQADIDALAQKLADLKAQLSADDASIQAEIDQLKAANPALDLSGLQSAVDDLSAQVDATTALVPPATPPAGQ